MRRKTHKRTVLLVALMAASLVATVFSPVSPSGPARAKPCYSTLYLYYSDDTYSDLVGEYDIACEGNPWRWGTVSPYVETDVQECGGTGCQGR